MNWKKICFQGAIEGSGEMIERLKAACHTKLSETESGNVRISPRKVCHLANLQFPVSQNKTVRGSHYNNNNNNN